jgi:hypothetical protein
MAADRSPFISYCPLYILRKACVQRHATCRRPANACQPAAPRAKRRPFAPDEAHPSLTARANSVGSACPLLRRKATYRSSLTQAGGGVTRDPLRLRRARSRYQPGFPSRSEDRSGCDAGAQRCSRAKIGRDFVRRNSRRSDADRFETLRCRPIAARPSHPASTP